MGQQYTLWGLNMAAGLLYPHKDEIIERYKGAIKFDDRRNYSVSDYDASKEIPINLMPGDEYFVPIAPKCIGNLFEDTSNPIVSQIHSYYKSKKQEDYKYFWDGGSWSKGEYAMRTKDYMGYYSLLLKTAPNILVGYSQGSLVPRYLLWLDKEVFKGNAIAGVITVSSPNYGSPLANPDNMANILSGILKIASIFIYGYITDEIIKIIERIFHSLESDDSKGLGGIFDPIKNVIVKKLFELMMDILCHVIKELNEHGHTKEADTLQQMYNWLGGLRNDPNNAFFDLNITRVTEPHSVLYDINHAPEYLLDKVYGILSINNDPRDIIHPENAQVVRNALNKKFKRLSAADHFVDGIINDIIRHFTKEDESAIVEAESTIDYDKIQEIFNTEVMCEHKKYKDPIIQSRVSDYNNGMSGISVPKYANDFVIPSSYQVTILSNQIPPDKNTVNADANHLTGSDLKYAAGQANYEYIIEHLDKLMKSLE